MASIFINGPEDEHSDLNRLRDELDAIVRDFAAGQGITGELFEIMNNELKKQFNSLD